MANRFLSFSLGDVCRKHSYNWKSYPITWVTSNKSHVFEKSNQYQFSTQNKYLPIKLKMEIQIILWFKKLVNFYTPFQFLPSLLYEHYIPCCLSTREKKVWNNLSYINFPCSKIGPWISILQETHKILHIINFHL